LHKCQEIISKIVLNNNKIVEIFSILLTLQLPQRIILLFIIPQAIVIHWMPQVLLHSLKKGNYVRFIVFFLKDGGEIMTVIWSTGNELQE